LENYFYISESNRNVIAIVDYGVGNLKSITKAIDKAGGKVKITRDPVDIESADAIILPGVGAVKPALEKLREIEGLIRKTDVPVMGICLGMQLFATESLEGGRHRCLNTIPGVVKKIPQNAGKIPHMGWNEIKIVRKHPILAGINDLSYVYFVHSYYLDTDENFVLTKTTYGIDFPSSVVKDNFIGFQFHPEKSGDVGLKIIENFVEM
jgi:glutamine amidotransferase